MVAWMVTATTVTTQKKPNDYGDGVQVKIMPPFHFFSIFPGLLLLRLSMFFSSFDSSQDYHWLFDGSLCQQIIHDGRVVGSRHRCNNNTYINIFGPLRWDLSRRVLSCTYPCTWFFLLRGWCDKKLWDGENYVVLFVIWRR